MQKNSYANLATGTGEPRGSPQVPNSQTSTSGRKLPSRRKTQKGPATDGQCHFNGSDYPSWLGFDPQKPGSAFKYPFPAVDGDPWEGAMRMMNEYDDDVCDAWNAEVQNLLIFSGLFSAVVTAFAVETQKLLQPDPENVTVQLLAQLNLQFITNAAAINSTNMLLQSILDSNPNPDGQTFRINCLIFSSLIISLGTALVGIIVLQWVRSFRKVEGGYDRDGISMREARQRAFETWRVPTIIAYLPVSLGISFIVFLIGLIDFLQSLDGRVAAIIGGLVGIIILFLLITTFLPAFHILIYKNPFPLCAYQSAQSLLCCRLINSRFKSVNEWALLITDLYKSSTDEVRDSWLKDSLVAMFRLFNSTHAFRLAYLCFQSIPKDVSKNVNLRWDIVSEVMRDSKDLSQIGGEMMVSIESKGTLSSVAASEFFSLLLLLWNSRLGSDYALHRAELNFRCIQTFSSLPKSEYQKLIDLWWKRSAPELTLADESKQWRPYLTTFLTTLQSTPTLDDVQRPLAFSLFWKLIAARIRSRHKPRHFLSQQSVGTLKGSYDHVDPVQSLAVVQDCLRVLSTWLLQIQALPPSEYRPMEQNQVLRYCLQPMFDYNVFTVDIANESSITQRPSSFLNFLDIFLDPNNQRLKQEWDNAIEHAWAEKWDDFLIESNLHLRYHSLLKNKKSLHMFSEPESMSNIDPNSSADDNSIRSTRTVSPEPQLDSTPWLSSQDPHPDALSEVRVITHNPRMSQLTFAPSLSVTPPGSYGSPIPPRPPVMTHQDGGRSMELHPLLTSNSSNLFYEQDDRDAFTPPHS